MDRVVVEIGDQVRPDDVYVRVSGEETRVTVNQEPEAEVLATLRGDIVDAIWTRWTRWTRSRSKTCRGSMR